jgi:hypothetical protein
MGAVIYNFVLEMASRWTKCQAKSCTIRGKYQNDLEVPKISIASFIFKGQELELYKVLSSANRR